MMNVLVTGNTRYLTPHLIEQAFAGMKVIVLGPTALKTSYRQRLTVLDTDQRDWALDEVFASYAIDQVVFLSNFLTVRSQEVGEGEHLQQLLGYCQAHQVARFCYLEGPQAGYQDHEQATLLAQSYEQLCLHEGRQEGVSIKVLRLPFLYSATYFPPYLDQLLEQWAQGKPARFQEQRDSDWFFMNADDLGSLLYKVLDDWTPVSELLVVPNSFRLTFQDLALLLHQLQPEVAISFTKAVSPQGAPVASSQDRTLRQRYGWFQQLNPLDDWRELLPARYLQAEAAGWRAHWQGLKDWFRQHPRLTQLLEVLVLFALSEGLALLLRNQQQFRVIDVRLLFIVLIAMSQGLAMGLLAAHLACLGLLVTYIASGNNWITLFYDPLNWVPFVIYLVTGAMVGRFQAEAQHDKAALARENALLRDKSHLIRQLYRDMRVDQSYLKKEMMGRRDSYGRLYDWVKRLNQPTPQAVLEAAQALLDDLVQPTGLAFYRVSDLSTLAPVEGLTHQPSPLLAETQWAALRDELATGQLWVNRQLDPSLPHYLAGLRYQNQLLVVVGLSEAQLDPLNLAHFNQLQVVFGLIELALQHALDRQHAV